ASALSRAWKRSSPGKQDHPRIDAFKSVTMTLQYKLPASELPVKLEYIPRFPLPPTLSQCYILPT
ncbi:MAG: hypothetical protein ACK5XN_06180, partial [Bacteroidota bacterium]